MYNSSSSNHDGALKYQDFQKQVIIIYIYIFNNLLFYMIKIKSVINKYYSFLIFFFFFFFFFYIKN